MIAALPANMLSKIVVAESGCWEWTGALNSRGYSCIGVEGKSQLAHRVAYELLVGPIPDGLTIDHLCMNKLCVNPAHLEPVTRSENAQRYNRSLSHCIRGHAFAGDNVYISTSNGYPSRQCRACNTIHRRQWLLNRGVKRVPAWLRNHPSRDLLLSGAVRLADIDAPLSPKLSPSARPVDATPGSAGRVPSLSGDAA